MSTYKIFFLQTFLLLQICLASEDDENKLQQILTKLTDNLEKLNKLYLNSLEAKMHSTTTLLTNINSNINNLQERAHVWDTFQLHITAWNDQLASLDRKADIISKGQEKLLEFESKVNNFANLDTKIDGVIKTLNNIQEVLSFLKEMNQNQYLRKDYDILFGEFATRGILSTVKMIEKKLDRLLISHQNNVIQQKTIEEKPKLTIKCNTPRFVEDLLNDISSKVDIIFDKISGKDESNDDLLDDYLNDSIVTNTTTSIQNLENSQLNSITKNINKISEKLSKTEHYTEKILKQQNTTLEKIDQILQQCEHKNKLNDRINNYENSLKNFLVKLGESKICPIDDNVVIYKPDNLGCEDLDQNSTSGVYIFDNQTANFENFSYNKRFCLFRNDEFWTVIQKRGNHPEENFNMSWTDYKNGFGNIYRDFWIGNKFISKMSQENNLILRVELEDFNGNYAWAEYDKFLVQSEEENYKLIIGNYKGNASDSFSSHNNSYFSTYDRKNDQAPVCCPCAISYGGGWWFNSCFECNLNGVYHKKGEYNAYYEGIIWENWLGNYSLKKTIMMVKISTRQIFPTSTLWPHYEDP